MLGGLSKKSSWKTSKEGGEAEEGRVNGAKGDGGAVAVDADGEADMGAGEEGCAACACGSGWWGRSNADAELAQCSAKNA